MPRARGEQSKVVQSVTRVVRILESFGVDEQELGITTLTNRTGLHPATVSRLLASLEATQLVEYNRATQRYRLGTKLFHLGLIVAGQMELLELSKPILNQVRDRTGESVTLTVIDGDQRVTVALAESRQDLRHFPRLGARYNLPGGTSGKVLMAYLPVAAQERLLAQYQPVPSPNPPADAEQLRAHLRQIREQGYAVTYQERVAELCGVGAPVRNHLGDVVGALSLSCPISRFTDEKLEQCRIEVLAGAAELSRRLGFPASPVAP